MATKKPAAKKPAKAPAKPVKKAVKPAPKPAKPAPKAAKPVAKKPVAKAKPAIVAPKKAAKPAPKAIVKKAVAAKPLAKKSLPAVKAKIVAKPLTKMAKPSPTPAPKKPIAEKKQAEKPMSKTPIEKKPAAKPVVKATPVVKAIAKNPKDIKITPAKPVVVPKFATKTTRKYQPDFTKSVLDQVKNDPGAPIVRYNDTDLMEFRELINRKLEAAKKELNYLQGLITRKDEMGGDESENRYMTMEDGSLSMEREQLSQMASRQITFIDHLEKAMMRIENKTYGICRVTGKLIDKARLRAVPHATLSIEAKQMMNK